ncbi:integral membrane sensor signal transduction histidine kinase [Sporocytophaga myxococcoides]|uniref:histidine kinase n=1 Tax=Sporocytophaga myxococcoides TaxID=153721 RepID=A0A098LEN7_9BACT|nr:HAMP domain-containing sensor histidine kinase [Sporocytophaga myxococcoides]GAL84887.1 integral membrane sensor signal transduction histidine kinase [Sporocytophaga myxococcoides]
MRIRNKLTIQFTGIVFCILIVFSASIYTAFWKYRTYYFRKRLKEKALNTTKMLIEVKEINTDLLKKLRRKYFLTFPNEFVRIYDKYDNLVYKDDTINYKLPNELLQKIRSEKNYSFSIKGRQVVGIDYDGTYVITASAIDKDGYETLKFLALSLFAGNFIALIIIFLSGKFFSSKALFPIADIIEEVDNINEGHTGLRLKNRDGKDEIATLANSFNNMFDRIEDTFENQSKFISHASHELRTPLTSITGEIDVALLKDRTSEEYKATLYSILEESLALTELSNKLLKLLQSNNKNLNADRINLRHLIDRLEEEIYERRYKNKFKIENRTSKELSILEIFGNEDLIKAALINVIDNGFKYSDYPVTLKISRQEGTKISFKVIDHGIGIDKDDLSKIIQPFYRSSKGNEKKGFGIGLSLTEKIVTLHKGTLEIFSKPKFGTQVTLTFPI